MLKKNWHVAQSIETVNDDQLVDKSIRWIIVYTADDRNVDDRDKDQ